jgi:cell division protein FtsL
MGQQTAVTLVLTVVITSLIIVEIYRHVYVYYLRWKVNKLENEIEEIKNKIWHNKQH